MMIANPFTRVFRCVLIILLAGAFLQAPVLQAQEEAARKTKKQVSPAYPPLAAQLKLSGTVKVLVVIDPSGKVTQARAVGGSPVLVAAAVDAAKRWVFEPADKETTEVLEFKFNGDDH